METNQLKLGIYLSYMSIFVTNITNLILTPFIIRNLGQSQYGLYMLIGALIGYIAVLDFGLGNTTVRYVAKYRAENNKKEQENFLSLTLIIYLIISFIVFLIGVIIYFNLNTIFGNSLTTDEVHLAKIMFIILVLNLAFTLPMNSFTSIINAYERFAIPKSLSIGRVLIRAMLIIIFLSLGFKALTIVIVDAILNVIIMIISMAYVFLKLKVRIRLHNFNKSLFKEILSYSSLIFVSVIVDQLYWRIGHLVLGIVASTSEVAVFAIGMTISQYFITFSTAISGVFLPKITKMVVNKTQEKELTNLLIKTGRLQLLILGLIISGFILFGHKFIILWVGSDFELSWLIALTVMVPLTFVLTQTIGISILQAKNMHGFRAIAYLVIALVNLIISVIFAKSHGAIGAVAGTTLSLIFGNIIVMNIYYHFRVGLNIPRFFKELSKGPLLSILLSISIGTLILYIPGHSWSTLAIQCFIYIVLYVVIMYFIGMNNNEKILLRNELSKIIKIKIN